MFCCPYWVIASYTEWPHIIKVRCLTLLRGNYQRFNYLTVSFSYYYHASMNLLNRYIAVWRCNHCSGWNAFVHRPVSPLRHGLRLSLERTEKIGDVAIQVIHRFDAVALIGPNAPCHIPTGTAQENSTATKKWFAEIRDVAETGPHQGRNAALPAKKWVGGSQEIAHLSCSHLRRIADTLITTTARAIAYTFSSPQYWHADWHIRRHLRHNTSKHFQDMTGAP